MEVITELSLIMCSCSQLIIVAVVLFYLEPIKPQFDFYFGPSVYVTSVVHQFKLVQITISSDNYETRKSEWSNYRHVSCGRDWSEFVILLV